MENPEIKFYKHYVFGNPGYVGDEPPKKDPITGEYINNQLENKKKLKDPSIKRHIAKTITWRIIGTIDTIILGWIITGNFSMAITIGGLEVFSKMLLYFIHERVWYKINFGLPNRKK